MTFTEPRDVLQCLSHTQTDRQTDETAESDFTQMTFTEPRDVLQCLSHTQTDRQTETDQYYTQSSLSSFLACKSKTA